MNARRWTYRFTIVENKQTSIGAIKVEGNRHTSANFARSQLRVAEGEVANTALIRRVGEEPRANRRIRFGRYSAAAAGGSRRRDKRVQVADLVVAVAEPKPFRLLYGGLYDSGGRPRVHRRFSESQFAGCGPDSGARDPGRPRNRRSSALRDPAVLAPASPVHDARHLLHARNRVLPDHPDREAGSQYSAGSAASFQMAVVLWLPLRKTARLCSGSGGAGHSDGRGIRGAADAHDIARRARFVSGCHARFFHLSRFRIRAEVSRERLSVRPLLRAVFQVLSADAPAPGSIRREAAAVAAGVCDAGRGWVFRRDSTRRERF